MYERILVPLDGSLVAEAALPFVEELVSKIIPAGKVEVTLFQAISPVGHFVVAGEASAQVPYTPEELALIRAKAEEYLNRVAQKLAKTGATVNIKVGVGNAAEAIIKAAEETNADLTAMSTHGRSGISRWAFGSVTDRVLRFGKTPILLVRAPRELERTI